MAKLFKILGCLFILLFVSYYSEADGENGYEYLDNGLTYVNSPADITTVANDNIVIFRAHDYSYKIKVKKKIKVRYQARYLYLDLIAKSGIDHIFFVPSHINGIPSGFSFYDHSLLSFKLRGPPVFNIA